MVNNFLNSDIVIGHMEISIDGPFFLFLVHGHFKVFISLLCYVHENIHGPLLKKMYYSYRYNEIFMDPLEKKFFELNSM